MKKLLVVFLALALVFTFAACTGENDPADGDVGIEKLDLKISFSGTDQGIDATGVNKFIELVDEASDGNIKVTGFSSAQLAGGNMQRQLELLMQGGAFELACLSEQVLAAAAPELNIVSTPFAFTDYDEVYAAFDGKGGEWFSQVLEGIGLKYLGTLSNGLVHITNNKHEIRTPDDIAGLKFRVYGGTQMKMMDLFGADAINMSWSEVYSAMQQGTINGHLNGWASIFSGNIMEVQDYITKMNANWGGFHFVMNLNDWNKLSPEAQQMIEECCCEGAVYAREVLDENEAEIEHACIEDYGCTVTELTEEEIAVFKEVCEPLIKSIKESCGEEACAAFGL